ncbi:MAG: PIN domain-containing protein [Nitrospinota bacterium]|nr:MAG: PIN domain-containing protein [Nitrospinota bacterium]
MPAGLAVLPKALAVLHPLAVTGLGVLSTQILAEFFVAVTQKIAAPLTVREARERIRNYLQSWEVVEVTGLIVLEATRGVQEYQFSFWDALVWATARLNQVPVLFSENFNPGQVTEGIVFVEKKT